MPTITHTLRDIDPESIDVLHGMCVQIFLDGECYAFATALSEGLAWPMIGLMDGQVIRHVGVKSPEGNVYDARGHISEEVFANGFGLTPPYIVRTVIKEELGRVGESIEVRANSVRLARKLAEAIWPELPWKESLSSRVRAFADELETLSRKHGLWIRSAIPAAVPVIATGDTEEGGYKLLPTFDGCTFTIERYFA
jgi:hypothetical protein